MNFFRINMPYGISKNENGEWMAFNRLYLPLGYYQQPKDGYYHVLDEKSIGLPVYNKYYGLTENVLLSLAVYGTAVKRSEDGKIRVVWFYDDATNPVHPHNTKTKKKLFELYFKKLEILAGKSVKSENNF